MFKGFSPRTQDFLWGIALNNEKPWFEAHKAEYTEYVKGPLRDLGSDVLERMSEMYPGRDWQIHVAGIYRDARRLFGRGPYKDHLWFNIMESGYGRLTSPTFWFYISPAKYGFGMGIYAPAAAQMERYRAAVDANPAPLERLIAGFEKQSMFVFEPVPYAKKKGNHPEPLSSWYSIKSFDLSCDRDFGGELYTPSLKDGITDGYAFLMPYYEYFLAATL
jgi:uncharacterized protein (TIGR02453 family)